MEGSNNLGSQPLAWRSGSSALREEWELRGGEGGQQPGWKARAERWNTSRPAPQSKKNDPGALKAMEEGRRLYVGNLPYEAKVIDVERLFAGGEYKIEKIDISVDLLTGRNPSYCFVELETSAQANQAMELLDGTAVLGRPVKIKPGVSKSQNSTSRPGQSSRELERRDDRPAATPYTNDRWRRADPEKHSEAVAEGGKRLYVGGLPQILDHETASVEMKRLFKDFEVVHVSKQISPHESKKDLYGNHYYLFVDFANPEQAADAKAKLNGAFFRESRVRVSHAKRNSKKFSDRDDWGMKEQSPKYTNPDFESKGP